MQVIAIDGACRRNGKPDCIAAGGVFVQGISDDMRLVETKVISTYETRSTNQRGELLALCAALDYILESRQDSQIITDSEYMFNTMTKRWYETWQRCGWLTAAGEPVKNRDLWEDIAALYQRCTEANIEINMYHIKGHCMPFGTVTANTTLDWDPTGRKLLGLVNNKFDEVFKRMATQARLGKLEHAQDLSVKNNGFKLDPEVLQRFVVANTVVDAIATKAVDEADLREHQVASNGS